MRTITIDYEDKHITLARATISDARVRRALFALLKDIEVDDKNSTTGTFCYYITQLVETDISEDKKLTVCPDAVTVHELYEDWCARTDEVLAGMIASAISQLMVAPDQKKASEKSLVSM